MRLPVLFPVAGKALLPASLLAVAALMMISGAMPGCAGSRTSSAAKNPLTTAERLALVPQKEDVGALRMPDTIAPVTAPFALPVFKKPSFPALTVSIAEKGARQGVLSTAAIQQSIDEVSRRGGGIVTVPRGAWKTGRISLRSNVNLHLEEGAELHFSGRVEDYRPAVFTRNEGVEVMSLGACIYANGQENIAVTGKGKLVGPEEGSVRKQVMNANVVEKFVPLDKPVQERVYEGYNGEQIFLPMFISPINCRNVYIEGITLERTAFWNIVPVYCDGVIIRGVTVNSVGIPRGDGIDIESSRNVLIEYCTLNNGDDCFTMKAGRGEDGMRVNKPTENVVVRYCLAMQGHGAITCGSETAGGIRNLYVHDCVFDNTGVGIRFKTRRPRGGGGKNLLYERIRMNLKGDAFNWDMLGSATYVGDLAKRLPPRPVNRLTPHYKNITARDLIITTTRMFIKVHGIPESPMSNLLIDNAEVRSRGLISIADADGITLKDLRIESRDSLINILDGRNILFDSVQFNVPGGVLFTHVSGPLSDNIRFENTSPAKPANWKAKSWDRKDH